MSLIIVHARDTRRDKAIKRVVASWQAESRFLDVIFLYTELQLKHHLVGIEGVVIDCISRPTITIHAATRDDSGFSHHRLVLDEWWPKIIERVASMLFATCNQFLDGEFGPDTCKLIKVVYEFDNLRNHNRGFTLPSEIKPGFAVPDLKDPNEGTEHYEISHELWNSTQQDASKRGLDVGNYTWQVHD